MTSVILNATDDGRRQIKLQTNPVEKAEKKALEHTTKKRPRK